MTDIIHGNIPVSVAAKVLRVDPQNRKASIAVTSLCPWGWHLKDSKKYSYLIFAKPFTRQQAIN